MTTITDYFAQAQLSLAAYALNLQQGMFGGTDQNSPYVKALTDAGMSAQQATTFASTYTVVEQSGGIGSPTGFSATLFQNAQTGQKFLAIRGTEPNLTIGPDLWADATIAFGNPFLNLQIPALVSFYDQLKTDGLVTPADTLTVSGHSLGGYLAQLLTMYDPVQVSQTCTYNAPGFTGASALAVSLLQLYMGTASGSNISAKLTNVQGMRPNIIAGLGSMIGGEQAVFTESATHSIATEGVRIFV